MNNLLEPKRPDVQVYRNFEPTMPPLYHYTSHAGLIGMVQHKKMWFTHAHYMNDSSEYNYAINLINQELQEEYGLDLDSHMNLANTSLSENVPYTFSLSERKDSLSQWRGYCPDGGYSISFNGEQSKDDLQLSIMMLKYGLYLGKCVYELAHQKELIRTHIVKMEPANCKDRFKPLLPPQDLTDDDLYIWEARSSKARDAKSADKYYFEQEVLERVLTYAPLFKDSSFKEEWEWRIISMNPINLTFRQGKSFLVPYLEIDLCDEGEHVKVKEVVVGPTPHMELAMKACELFLRQHKAESKVTASVIPYCNW